VKEWSALGRVNDVDDCHNLPLSKPQRIVCFVVMRLVAMSGLLINDIVGSLKQTDLSGHSIERETNGRLGDSDNSSV
jgi:hypothetical protein